MNKEKVLQGLNDILCGITTSKEDYKIADSAIELIYKLDAEIEELTRLVKLSGRVASKAIEELNDLVTSGQPSQ